MEDKRKTVATTAFDPMERELPYRTIVKWSGGLLLSLVVIMALMYVFFLPQHVKIDPSTVLNRRMSIPPLQPRPADDLKKFRQDERRVLTSYGWVDKAAGAVRIPVSRAMDLLLERGLPAREVRQ